MKLSRKGHGRSHRGIIGIESAIVLIAFVIVAAALAFVVLNMGFATTQKAKTSIISSLGEAGSSLEVSGKIIGIGCLTAGTCTTTTLLNATAVPIRIASGGESVNLNPTTIAIKYLSNTIEYDNIYKGTLNTTTHRSLNDAMNEAVTVTYIDSNPIVNSVPTNTQAFFYFSISSTPINSILDPGEHATLGIAFRDLDRPVIGDKIRIEVIGSTGATLTVERDVPNITGTIVDLS